MCINIAHSIITPNRKVLDPFVNEPEENPDKGIPGYLTACTWRDSVPEGAVHSETGCGFHGSVFESRGLPSGTGRASWLLP